MNTLRIVHYNTIFYTYFTCSNSIISFSLRCVSPQFPNASTFLFSFSLSSSPTPFSHFPLLTACAYLGKVKNMLIYQKAAETWLLVEVKYIERQCN